MDIFKKFLYYKYYMLADTGNIETLVCHWGGCQFSAQNGVFSPKRWSHFSKKITARSLGSRKMIIARNISLHNLVSKIMFFNFMHTHMAHFLAYEIFFWKKKQNPNFSKFCEIARCACCAHIRHKFFLRIMEKKYMRKYLQYHFGYIFIIKASWEGKKQSGPSKLGYFKSTGRTRIFSSKKWEIFAGIWKSVAKYVCHMSDDHIILRKCFLLCKVVILIILAR